MIQIVFFYLTIALSLYNIERNLSQEANPLLYLGTNTPHGVGVKKIPITDSVSLYLPGWLYLIHIGSAPMRVVVAGALEVLKITHWMHWLAESKHFLSDSCSPVNGGSSLPWMDRKRRSNAPRLASHLMVWFLGFLHLWPNLQLLGSLCKTPSTPSSNFVHKMLVHSFIRSYKTLQSGIATWHWT